MTPLIQLTQDIETRDQLADRALDLALPELHRRDVYVRGETFWPVCSCRWVGLPQISWSQAASVGCDVEIAIAEGQERRRRILGAADVSALGQTA